MPSVLILICSKKPNMRLATLFAAERECVLAAAVGRALDRTILSLKAVVVLYSQRCVAFEIEVSMDFVRRLEKFSRKLSKRSAVDSSKLLVCNNLHVPINGADTHRTDGGTEADRPRPCIKKQGLSPAFA
jgi:hypothetical protein